MDWDDLRIVLALARQGTHSSAARVLGVTHPTVARRLARLQENLGTRLFEHTPEGWRPTMVGERVLESAERIEDELLELERKVRGHDVRLSGVLRVSTLDVMAAMYGEHIHSFTRAYPDIELELSASNTSSSLTRREIDVLFWFSNAPPENLLGHRVAHVEYAIYGQTAMLDEEGFNRENPDFEALPWLHWTANMGARVTDGWIKRNVPGARIVCKLDQAMVMVDYIRRGMGVMIMPYGIVDNVPGVERLTGPMEGFTTQFWLLTLLELRTTGRVRAFLQHMKTEIAKSRG